MTIDEIKRDLAKLIAWLQEQEHLSALRDIPDCSKQRRLRNALAAAEQLKSLLETGHPEALALIESELAAGEHDATTG